MAVEHARRTTATAVEHARQATATAAERARPATATAYAQAIATVEAKAPAQVEIKLVAVPAGTFVMGSRDSEGDTDEHPQHDVYIDAFRIGKTEVTNAQYQKCVDAGVCKPNEDYGSVFNGPNQPVVGVSWDDAQAFCKWAGLRLPTEAQWEKAARGIGGREYPWGNEEPNCKKAQYGNCSGKTLAVGSKPAGASPYGALDMAGNAWEWVADWYNGGYYEHSPVRNPTGPTIGKDRVLRGGSWANYPIFRSAGRFKSLPDFKADYIGFRCAAPSP